MLEINQIHQGDCMVLMKEIEDNSVDMILCDLPYGTTACEWDKEIPLDKLWREYLRIIKDKGAIVLTCREPFTAKLIMSNLKMYRHKWVWNKKLTGNFALAKFMPLQIEEDIIVFGKNSVNYYPIMRKGKERNKVYVGQREQLSGGFGSKEGFIEKYSDYFPVNIIEIPNTNRKKIKHPTEKPIKLFRYLIKTYTQEEELVLDNCIGSGTTAIACKQTNRNFIGIELNPEYVDICNKRLSQKTMFEIAEKRDTLTEYMEVSADSSQP